MSAVLEIHDYDGAGYQPLVDFADWRVAILRYLDALEPARIDSMERHLETDEVFILLKGRGVLLLGGNDLQVGDVVAQPMEIGKVYNIKQCAWHSVLLTRDASVLLVENQDTAEHNTEFLRLNPQQRRTIQQVAEREGFA